MSCPEHEELLRSILAGYQYVKDILAADYSKVLTDDEQLSRAYRRQEFLRIIHMLQVYVLTFSGIPELAEQYEDARFWQQLCFMHLDEMNRKQAW